MNTVNLIGRFTVDPEVKYVSGDIPMIYFYIATDRPYKSKDGERITDFIRCEAWHGLAEVIAKYFKKGDQIGITGHLESTTYKARGEIEVKTFFVRVNNIDFIRPRKGSTSDGPQESQESQEAEGYSGDDLPF